MSKTYRCDCGDWSGEPCQWTGEADDMVIVEWMANEHRASHAAAGNSGSFPDNGSRRIVVERSCAELMIDTDGEWVRIVGEANATPPLSPDTRDVAYETLPDGSSPIRLSRNIRCF